MKIVDCILLSPTEIVYLEERLEWIIDSINEIAKEGGQDIPSLDKDPNRIMIRRYIIEMEYLLEQSKVQ